MKPSVAYKAGESFKKISKCFQLTISSARNGIKKIAFKGNCENQQNIIEQENFQEKNMSGGQKKGGGHMMVKEAAGRLG